MSGGSDTKKPRNPLPWCLGSANFLGQVVKPPLISISRRVSSLLTQSLCFFFTGLPSLCCLSLTRFPLPLSFQLSPNLNKNLLTGQTPKLRKVSHTWLGDTPYIGSRVDVLSGDLHQTLCLPPSPLSKPCGVCVGRAHSHRYTCVPSLLSLPPMSHSIPPL